MQVKISGKTVWLNFHHLYYFYVIATRGSISEASVKLGIGQPALSAQLKQFESALNVSLFERRAKRLVLTESGRSVVEYARDIFKMGGELVEVIQDKRTLEHTHVQIGALDSIPKNVVVKLVQKALSISPCSISILEGKSDELMKELIQHRIDLFVSNYVPARSDGAKIYSKRVARTGIRIYGSQRFRGLSTGFPESLGSVPLILPTGHSKLRHDVEHFLRLSGIAMPTILETQDTALQMLLGVEGLGVLPAPAAGAAPYVERRELFELGALDGIEEQLFLVSASRKIENPISTRVMKEFSLDA